MLSVTPTHDVHRVLVIGSHADDIEIGCFGTVAALLDANPEMHVTWVVLSAIDTREEEARASAGTLLSAAHSVDIEVHGYRDAHLLTDWTALKKEFHHLSERSDPQLILTHARGDAHQDHRLVCELTWTTFRDQLILEYEIPKWDGDLGQPNVYVPLPDAIVDRKIDHLLRFFPSQTRKHWYDAETFRAIMRLRGVECGARYAEAFTMRKGSLVP